MSYISTAHLKELRKHTAEDEVLQTLSAVIQLGFCQTWDFIHVTSSPEFPQSNGLAESAVRSAKQLMEKSHRDGTRVFLSLLNLGNIPCDPTLGSPAERLMSQHTHAAIPVSTQLLEPASKNTQQINAQLLNKQLILKRHHDTPSHPLRSLAEGQVVRMQTPSQLGTVGEVSKEPHHPVQWENIHVLPVTEQPPPQFYAEDPDSQNTGPSTMDSVLPIPQTPEPGKCQAITTHILSPTNSHRSLTH